MHPTRLKNFILDQHGKPMLRKPDPDKPLDLNAYVDVSYITEENAEHWSWARAGDANTNLDFRQRVDSRRRARYEVQNNNFLMGLVETIATASIGPGAVLEMQTTDKNRNRQIERDWKSWSEVVGLWNKLCTQVRTKVVDGEIFGLAILREAIDHFVKLDLQVIESDQCGSPTGEPDTEFQYDGIRMDQFGMPIQYHLYDHHPFQTNFFPTGGQLQGQWYEPNRVIHMFNQGRPGQLRGVSELAPALPMSAIWRRNVLAATLAMENVANISMAMRTNTSANTEPVAVAPMSTLNWPRNQLVTLPEGWEPFQIKAEQPVDKFCEIDKCIKLDIARSLGIPANLALLDSGDSNYSSARVDQIPWFRTIDTLRANQIELRCLEKLFNLWIVLYADGGNVFEIDSQDIRREFPHRWIWVPHQPIDEEKRANALKTLWEMAQITDDDIQFLLGKDPETHNEQLAEQIERRKLLGLPLPGQQPGIFEPQPQPGVSPEAQEVG